MPNSHQNSSLMRVQNETKEKIVSIAKAERRAANAQLAVIVVVRMRLGHRSASPRIASLREVSDHVRVARMASTIACASSTMRSRCRSPRKVSA